MFLVLFTVTPSYHSYGEMVEAFDEKTTRVAKVDVNYEPDVYDRLRNLYPGSYDMHLTIDILSIIPEADVEVA